jgi:hypothetical protein
MNHGRSKSARPKRVASTTSEIEYAGNVWTDVLPTSAEEIARAQALSATQMPESWRRLVAACNGGRPGKNFVERHGFESCLGRLIPVLGDGTRRRPGLVDVNSNLRKNASWPAGLAPFAFDDGNANYFCVRVRDGSVVLWLHDEDDARRVREVASSIDDLLAALTERPY